MSEENKPVEVSEGDSIEGLEEGKVYSFKSSKTTVAENDPYSYKVGDAVLLYLAGEPRPFGGIIKEASSIWRMTVTDDKKVDWIIYNEHIVRSAVTSPAALKDALASINPSKSLGKSEKKAFDGSESLPSK